MANNDAADDLRLPQAVIARLVKEALPPGVIISKEARTAIARAAAVFILHASTYAQECAVSNKRKTVTAVDVLNAVRVLECDELERPIKEAVEIWRAARQTRIEEARKRKTGRPFGLALVGLGLLPSNTDIGLYDGDSVSLLDRDNEQPEAKRPAIEDSS